MATLCGLYLTWVAGWPVVAIGVASIASGVAYTGGPKPLGYQGLGDVFVLVFFGFVAVAGTAYVQTGTWTILALAAGLPVGALATAILIVNNVRDRHTDVHAGKRTLAVRFGKVAALAEYAACFVAAYLVPVGLAVALGRGGPLLPLLTAPWAFGLWKELSEREGTPLNATLASTARLLLVHGLLFALGLALGGPAS
jgi:1,4-dihydroxy-2-naphthoate octaprenyltransferase